MYLTEYHIIISLYNHCHVLRAAGLINDAVKKGYKAYFTTMEDLINILRMKDLTASALAAYNR